MGIGDPRFSPQPGLSQYAADKVSLCQDDTAQGRGVGMILDFISEANAKSIEKN